MCIFARLQWVPTAFGGLNVKQGIFELIRVTGQFKIWIVTRTLFPLNSLFFNVEMRPWSVVSRCFAWCACVRRLLALDWNRTLLSWKRIRNFHISSIIYTDSILWATCKLATGRLSQLWSFRRTRTISSSIQFYAIFPDQLGSVTPSPSPPQNASSSSIISLTFDFNACQSGPN